MKTLFSKADFSKGSRRRGAVLGTMLLAALACASCQDDPLQEDVVLDRSALTLMVGESETLIPDPSIARVSWASSNQHVVTVVRGRVTAVAEGEALVYAQLGKNRTFCTITVIPMPMPVQGVMVNVSEALCIPGQHRVLRPVFIPDNASNRNVTWSSNDPGIVSVDAETGEITAHSVGTATVTVTAEDSGRSGDCAVTVTPVTGVIVKERLNLFAGGARKLTVTTEPVNAPEAVRWSSNNSAVALVHEASGEVTGVTLGSAVVTATAGGMTADCTVSVIGLESYTEVVNGVSFNMIAVEGGNFTMGGTAEQGADALAEELPAHPVTLSSFFMGEVVVTQKLWHAITGGTPGYGAVDWGIAHGLGDNVGAYRITWNDAQAFLELLNQVADMSYRLPTEAEWEFAARGGIHSQGYKYSGSNTAAEVAWFAGGIAKPDVAQKLPNELGLYDMSGYCFEFCSDYYAPYTAAPQINPRVETGAGVVIRGGACHTAESYARVSSRWRGGSDNVSVNVRWDNVGVRLVCDSPE